MLMLPIIAQAQISMVTESQKQEALQKVTDFCSLLTQWSNGQRTLDSQIYALCSGNDCSAFDDVTTMNETTLRNYLLGIQKKYPIELSLQVSNPSLSSIVYQPIINFSLNSETIGNGYVNAQVESYSNAFLVYNVNHTIMGTKDLRKIIYDVKLSKITAYIKGDGTFVSILEGLTMFTRKDYQSAISKFEYAKSNKRASYNN